MQESRYKDQGLFRIEVIEERHNSRLGEVRLYAPASLMAWSIGSVILIILIATIMIYGTYTRRERVTGVLMPTAGLIQLSSWSSGTILDVKVREGDHVIKGQVLALLSGEHVSQAFGNTSENVSESLKRQRDHLQHEINDAILLSRQQIKGLREQKKDIELQIKEDIDLTRIYSEDANSEQVVLNRMRPLLSRGYISQLQYHQQEVSLFNARAQLKNAFKSREEYAEKLASLTDQIARNPISTREQINNLMRQIEELNQSLDQNEAGRLTELRATCNGVVSSLLIRQGQNVTVGQTLIAQVPENSPLQGVLLIPSSAVGFVQKGSRVALHYDAYPYQKFGIQYGIVKSISTNALNPKDVAEISGNQASEEPQYEVIVDLNKQSVTAYGKRYNLITGMAVSADILLDRRRLIEWVFDPLYGFQKNNYDN